MEIKKRKRKGSVYDAVRPFVYQSPALLTIIALQILPMAVTVYYSFTNYNLNHLSNYHTVGFKNYLQIINGPFRSIFFPVLGFLNFQRCF